MGTGFANKEIIEDFVLSANSALASIELSDIS
jgi:hypothetical protein